MDPSYIMDIARGAKTGISTIRKFGHNSDIDVAWEHVWDGGGTYPYPTAAAAVRVKAGGHVNDTAAGDGARSVTIQGLDENWEVASETIATAGASASSLTTTTFIRVFRVNVASVGVYGAANTDDIEIETTAASTLAIILAGMGQTTMALYTIPAGKVGYLLNVSVEMEADKVIDAQILRRENADDAAAPMSPIRLVSEWGAQGEYIDHTYAVPPSPFPAKTDVIVRAKKIGAGTASTTVEFGMLLYDEVMIYD